MMKDPTFSSHPSKTGKSALREPLLQAILSEPSAPFRERHVINVIVQELKQASVPHFRDPIGNVVIGVKDLKAYRSLLGRRSPVKGQPLPIFIAHLDHPGFHGLRWASSTELKAELEVKWHGGSPTAHLEGAQVWLADDQGWAGQGTMERADLIPSGRAIDTARIRVSEELAKMSPNAKKLFGGFSFRQAMWRENELIYTKAADDLVGAFTITQLALDYWKKGKLKSKAPFIGLLTRAEEVGFVGAIGHFELGLLSKAKREVLCVSLETSRTLPGAEIGKGPVVRLGDRMTVFDPGALRVFTDLAEKELPGKHQRRIMDGGSCEATAATAYGLRSIGISVPLGNYHNQGLEGGPDSRGQNGPSPEFVHLSDIEGMLTLCKALVKKGLPWSEPWSKKRKDLRKTFLSYRSHLKTPLKD